MELLKIFRNKIFSQILRRQCPEYRCELTTENSQLNTSDAVLVHLVDLARENYTFPATRHPDQIWIAMTYEPPYILQSFGLDLSLLNGIFNRTMSYRLDGDVVVSYGTFHELRYPHNVKTHVSNWIDSSDSVYTRNYAEGKTRLIAWFVSSHKCESQSGREVYVRELQKYIPVDIYGECGPYKCGIRRTMQYPYNVEEDDCYMMISVEYKFVLAFENSLRQDYATEKLYNNLRLNAVPIVFGLGNYTKLTPSFSVIEAMQYKPKDLADYLLQLDKDDIAYNEYFRWKENYIVESNNMAPNPCQLCEQLHNPIWQREKKVYKYFDKWILSGCEEGYKYTGT